MGTSIPTEKHTPTPTENPTSIPTEKPAPTPTDNPTSIPTEKPTPSPTDNPTTIPTAQPTPSPTKVQDCAAENETTTACGGKKGKASCCDGLQCHVHQFWKCVKNENKLCAGLNTVSVQCGSTWKKAAPKCCSGLMCKSRKCIEAYA